MDFELHSEGSDIEFSMVFTDPNACRQCYEKLRIMVVFTSLLRLKTSPKTTQRYDRFGLAVKVMGTAANGRERPANGARPRSGQRSKSI